MHGTSTQDWSPQERAAGWPAGRAAGARENAVALLRRALAGESLTLDRDGYSLHELTQLALALKPHATLAIRQAATMTPIEQASIGSVGRGRVTFL